MNQIQIQSNSFKIDKTHLKNIIKTCLEKFDVQNTLVSVSFVSSEEIRELNQQHRNIDKTTDVLSFPQIKIPSAQKQVLGDIIISLADVLKKEENLDDVLKHGLLHLLDYDHEENQESWEKAAGIINCNL